MEIQNPSSVSSGRCFIHREFIVLRTKKMVKGNSLMKLILPFTSGFFYFSLSLSKLVSSASSLSMLVSIFSIVGFEGLSLTIATVIVAVATIVAMSQCYCFCCCCEPLQFLLLLLLLAI